MLPPRLLALFPQLDCGIWNGGSPIDRSYPTIQFTSINTRQGRSSVDGRISKPQHKSIAPPRKTRREVIDLTEDSSNDDLESNTLQPKTVPKAHCMNGEFTTPTVGEKTVFLLCSLRLDAVYDGPPAVLEEVLSLTLQAMGHCGRACLDSSPATSGCTFHICRDINCERNCRR